VIVHVHVHVQLIVQVNNMILKVYNDSKYSYDTEANLSIDNDIVNLQTTSFINNKKNQFKTSLSFFDLKNRINSSGFDRWVIELLPNGNHNLINLYAETSNDKLPAQDYFIKSNSYGLIHIIIRAEDDNFNDAIFFVNLTKDSKLECNKEYTITEREITKPPKFYYPKISLSEIDRNNNEINIAVVSPSSVNKDIYIKTNYGHTPTKIKLVNGKGKFIFTPIGMSNEDVATVKVGYRFYSNIASIQLKK